jgi:cob(I)alamin adenosyltransferase
MEILNEARKGYVHVYTGDGKGKTTAALGLVLRAVGAGYRVLIVQFMKGTVYSEIKALDALGENVEVKQYGRSECFVGKQPSREDSDWAARGLQEAIVALRTRQYDLVVLDELAVAQRFNLVTVEDVMVLLKERPSETEVVITGRWAHPAIVAQADLVTEMREVKHYYQTGVLARTGIER